MNGEAFEECLNYEEIERGRIAVDDKIKTPNGLRQTAIEMSVKWRSSRISRRKVVNKRKGIKREKMCAFR